MKKIPLKKLWLIRHAEAVDAGEFAGNDLDRPLTVKGRRSATRAFRRLAAARKGPPVVLSSRAVRAVETAHLFCRAFGIKKNKETPSLNPGCRFSDIQHVLAALPKGTEFAALVGHEPDLSEAVSRFTSDGGLSLILKKGAVVELEFTRSGTVNLTMVVPPDLLA